MGAQRNISGIVATPLFLEIVQQGNITTSNGSVKPFVNVWHFFQVTVVPVLCSLNELCDAFLANMEASLEAALPIAYANGTVKARFLDDPSFPYNIPRGDIDGAVTGDRATTFNSVCFQLRTDARGRNFRGSKHLGPVAESQTTLDNLNGGALTLWGAVKTAYEGLFGGGLQDGVAGGSWSPIVISSNLSDRESTPSVFTFAYVNGVVVNPTVGTMRRRKEKVVPV